MRKIEIRKEEFFAPYAGGIAQNIKQKKSMPSDFAKRIDKLHVPLFENS